MAFLSEMYMPQFEFLPGTTQLRLQASSEAAAMRRDESEEQPPPKSAQEVEAAARERVSALLGDPSDRRWVLSQMELQFGQYRGKSFHWLLSNDLGYTLELLASHQVEQEAGGADVSPLLHNKKALLEYAQLFESVISGLFTGDQLVGFGTHRSLSYRELYESSDPVKKSYVAWVRAAPVQHAGSRLGQLRSYFLRRDAAAQPAPSAPSTSTPATRSSSRRTSRQSRPLTPRKRSAAVIKVSKDDNVMAAAAAAAEPEPSTSAASSLPRPPRLRPTPVAPPPPPPPLPLPPPPSLPSAPSAEGPGAEVNLPISWKRSLPVAQQEWVSKALFVQDRTGRTLLSRDLPLWHHPPGPRRIYSGPPTSPDAFFQRSFFLWAPYRMWEYHLKCPGCACKLTGCGLYKSVRRVLDLDDWYYMGTEYLECRYCTRKVAGWSRSVREQLDLEHQLLFPAVLAYRLAVDKKVLHQMKGRTLGDGANRLRSLLMEGHTKQWMNRCLRYLGTVNKFPVERAQLAPPPPPPEMLPIPPSGWLLSTYCRETFTRMEELQAGVTSVFGSVLKMDSTKKVLRKLAEDDARTAQWLCSVGNEHGQVLMSVLTVAEGCGLRDMARGLQRRYELAERRPPEVLYVCRDCCRPDGRAGAARALFPSWPGLQVRLDARTFMRRLAGGVTSESHAMYPAFMRRVSASVFEWDPEDLSRLRDAKRGESSGPVSAFTMKELARHCRRHTRGAQETERLLSETIRTFMGVTDTFGVPLLDRARMEEIWASQRRHVACIQDPACVQLYYSTRQLNREGVVLPVLRCARGSSSLESFHLHLSRFIPGTSPRGVFFQMFLLEGLARWNEDRAREAKAGGVKAATRCYPGEAQRRLSQLSQCLLGTTLVESYSQQLPYTGELIGVSYLYAQTGQVLQTFEDDPHLRDWSEEVELEEEEEDEEEEGQMPDFMRQALEEGVAELPEGSPDPPAPPAAPPVSQGKWKAASQTAALEAPAQGRKCMPSTGSGPAPATTSTVTRAASAVSCSLDAPSTSTGSCTHELKGFPRAMDHVKPKSTVYNRQKLQLQQEAAARKGVFLKVRAPSVNMCSVCGVRKIKETGHRLLSKPNGQRVSYCPVEAKGKSPEDWLAEH